MADVVRWIRKALRQMQSSGLVKGTRTKEHG
jgi:hypothetical protein